MKKKADKYIWTNSYKKESVFYKKNEVNCLNEGV